MTVQPLFEKFSHKGLTLPNAFVMDPVFPVSPHGVAPEQDVASLYRGRSAYEVGLMLSEQAAVDRPLASVANNLPHFYGDAALEGWQRVHDGMVKAGSIMAPKIWHMGNVAPMRAGGAPEVYCEGPSNRFGPDIKHHHGFAMDEGAIQATVAAYGRAAAQAHRMGFLAVEIDAAQGGLIDQFFWDATNDRKDGYGGQTLKERSRFAREVLQAVRQATHASFTIIMRLSQDKPCAPRARLANTCQEMEQWLSPLVEGGADILHCTQGQWARPEFAGSPLNFAGWAKQITGLPVITSGRVGLSNNRSAEIEQLCNRKGQGEFDLIALDHILACEANWVTRLKHGEMEAMAPIAAQTHVHLVV